MDSQGMHLAPEHWTYDRCVNVYAAAQSADPSRFAASWYRRLLVQKDMLNDFFATYPTLPLPSQKHQLLHECIIPGAQNLQKILAKGALQGNEEGLVKIIGHTSKHTSQSM